MDDIIEEYRSWVTSDNYLVLNRLNLLDYTTSTFAVLLAKRGNSYYTKRTKQRFKELTKNIQPQHYFNPHQLIKQTSALWVTLTYDTKLCSFHQAWLNIAKEYNRFMSRLRKEYGRVASIRCFEAFDNGHPHIHALLIFQDHKFDVELRFDGKTKNNQNNAPCWRIKQDVTIETFWHSRVDIQAQQSTSDGIRYIAKYITKAIDFERATSKTLKTLALGWLYNRRSYSLSGKFLAITGEELTSVVLTSSLRNSNRKVIQQSTLFGEPLEIYSYTFLGVVPASELSLSKHQKTAVFIELDDQQIIAAESYLNSKYS